ncbi:MAG TPA: thioredoxin domain-containing protein [Thermoanaerobaculia bacterium]|nr:thioredoxin domain-containing protein [Thermoanaerobaculia bacterium]
MASKEIPDSQVLAKYGDQSITAGDVRKKAASDFDQLELRLKQCQAEYEKSKHDVMENQVKKVVQDALIAKEAAAKNMTTEAYLASAVKVADVTDAEVDAFYEENKARIPPTTTKEQIAPQIKSYLGQQRQAEARDKFQAELETKYAVAYTMEPMRVEVAATGPAKGPKEAPVTIVEFSDFQCPFCGKLTPTIDQVTQTYGDKVRLVFRQFPLNFHQFAQKAAEASLCANEQGKFWDLHDAMFKNQNDLAVDKLKAKAAELGLKADQFNSCLDSGKYVAQITEDQKAGSEAGVSGTPALFVNGRFISGAVPYTEIAKVVDDELKRKGVAK